MLFFLNNIKVGVALLFVHLPTMSNNRKGPHRTAVDQKMFDRQIILSTMSKVLAWYCMLR